MEDVMIFSPLEDEFFSSPGGGMGGGDGPAAFDLAALNMQADMMGYDDSFDAFGGCYELSNERASDCSGYEVSAAMAMAKEHAPFSSVFNGGQMQQHHHYQHGAEQQQQRFAGKSDGHDITSATAAGPRGQQKQQKQLHLQQSSPSSAAEDPSLSSMCRGTCFKTCRQVCDIKMVVDQYLLNKQGMQFDFLSATSTWLVRFAKGEAACAFTVHVCSEGSGIEQQRAVVCTQTDGDELVFSTLILADIEERLQRM